VNRAVLALIAASLCAAPSAAAEAALTLGHPDRPCAEDPHCFNRLHPDVPMAGRAKPGETIVLRTRNALDFDLAARSEGRLDPLDLGPVHPLTGPVHVEGAEPGDALAVTLTAIDPGPWGITILTPFGYAADLHGESLEVMWRLTDAVARSEALPGVAIPNAAFPGVVTTLPGPQQVREILRRETALAAAGGDVYGPDPAGASPAAVCGPERPAAAECLRTIPPREHGGNMDIRYQGVGVTIYLPCYVAGCGLAVGDLHYAQGDGEVAGMAIEMDADVTLTARVVVGGAAGLRGPRYEGPAELLAIPSKRFFATTGIPVKAAGEVPAEIAYLGSAKVAPLENLSRDVNLAARNALDEMLDYIATTYGYTRAQAHVIASVAVDLRIGQLVDAPNVGVTAILPLDVFERRPRE